MIFLDSSNIEMLKYAIDCGIIDFNTIQTQIEMNERTKYLEMHPYSIWEDGNKNWNTYLPDEEKGRIRKKRKSKKDIEDMVIDYWKVESDNPTIKEVFEEWNDRRLELQKISSATHHRNEQLFNRHFKEFGTQKIKNIESDSVVDFLEEQIPKHNLKAKAFSNLKGITKGLFKRAKKKKLINWNIEEAFYELDISECDFKKDIKEDCQEVFDEYEMPKIVEYLIENIDLRNMGILLMFVTGIRLGELVSLKTDVLEEDYFKIRRTETRSFNDGHYIYEVKEYPKSNAGVRNVVIPEDYLWLYEKIKVLNTTGGYVFRNEKGERLTTVAIRRRLERICKKLNIYHKSPNKIRKTYGSILLDNNVDKRLIIGQMGHSEIACTETHYHRNRRSVDNKRKIVSNIPEFKILNENSIENS